MLPTEQIFIIIAVLLLASVFASKASGRLGVPALLLFLTVGMLAGSDGIGQIEFDDPVTAKFIGDFALTIILFTGGIGYGMVKNSSCFIAWINPSFPGRCFDGFFCGGI